MRIVFSDLDGTLLSSEKAISARSWEALDALAGRGVEFVPCSGRPIAGIPDELLAHPAVRHAVCANGAAVFSVGKDGRPHTALRHVPMGTAAAAELYELVRERDLLFDVFADDAVFSERARFERMDRFGVDEGMLAQLRATRTPIDEPISELLRQVRRLDRLSIYWRDPADRDLVREFVATRPELVCVRSLPMNLEVSSAAATKGAALVWLCAHLGIPVRESVAFGDGLNDASMLEAAGDGVAMANAMAEALAAADHLTAGNDDCGVARYLERLLAQ